MKWRQFRPNISCNQPLFCFREKLHELNNELLRKNALIDEMEPKYAASCESTNVKYLTSVDLHSLLLLVFAVIPPSLLELRRRNVITTLCQWKPHQTGDVGRKNPIICGQIGIIFFKMTKCSFGLGGGCTFQLLTLKFCCTCIEVFYSL